MGLILKKRSRILARAVLLKHRYTGKRMLHIWHCREIIIENGCSCKDFEQPTRWFEIHRFTSFFRKVLTSKR